MNYIERTKSESEDILGYFNINRFMYWNAYMIMLVGIAIFVTGFIIPFEEEAFNMLFWGAGIFALFTGLYTYLRLSSINMGITNKRIVVKRGIVAIKTDEIRLQAIETIDVDQGISGRILGFGNVKITGKGDAVVLYEGVDEPLKIKKAIETVVSKFGDRQQ